MSVNRLSLEDRRLYVAPLERENESLREDMRKVRDLLIVARDPRPSQKWQADYLDTAITRLTAWVGPKI